MRDDVDVRVTFEDSTGARPPTTIAFRRDATRRGRVVRASGAGGTGHATRLARVDDDPPEYLDIPSLHWHEPQVLRAVLRSLVTPSHVLCCGLG